MSKQRWSAGPWRARRDDARNLWIEAPGREREVCDLNPYAPNDEPTEEDFANAALICAAPLMAEALEAQDSLVAHIRGCDACEDGEPCEVGRRMVDEADRLRREALAAALREAENLCDELRWDGSIQECDKRRIIRVWENLRVLVGREPAGESKEEALRRSAYEAADEAEERIRQECKPRCKACGGELPAGWKDPICYYCSEVGTLPSAAREEPRDA